MSRTRAIAWFCIRRVSALRLVNRISPRTAQAVLDILKQPYARVQDESQMSNGRVCFVGVCMRDGSDVFQTHTQQ